MRAQMSFEDALTRDDFAAAKKIANSKTHQAYRQFTADEEAVALSGEGEKALKPITRSIAFRWISALKSCLDLTESLHAATMRAQSRLIEAQAAQISILNERVNHDYLAGQQAAEESRSKAADMARRLDELGSRIDRIKPMKYVGVYRTGASHVEGEVVTYGGSMWFCMKDTSAAPPGADWQLCVQRGRDAKEQRK